MSRGKAQRWLNDIPHRIVQRLTVLGYDLKDMSQVLIACHYLETVPFTDRGQIQPLNYRND